MKDVWLAGATGEYKQSQVQGDAQNMTDHQCCTHFAKRYEKYYEPGVGLISMSGEECCICGLWTPTGWESEQEQHE